MSKSAVLIAAALMLTLVFSGCLEGPKEESTPTLGDVTPPEIELLTPKNDSFIKPGSEIEFLISDSELKEARSSIDGRPYEILRPPFKISTQEWGESTHRVNISAEDKSGNTAYSGFVFHIDLTAPMISLIFPSNNSALESSGLIKLSIKDENLMGANYTLDDGGPRILPSPFEIPVKWWVEGGHNITVNACDMALNRASKSYHFVIDNKPTEIKILSPDSRVIKAGTAIIFEIDEDNLVNLTCTINGERTEFSSYIIDTNGWQDGSYSIEINASDLAGHRISRSYLFEIDSQAPQLRSSISDGSDLVMNGTLDCQNYTFDRKGGIISIYPQDEHLLSVQYSINDKKYFPLKSPYSINLFGIRGKQANITIKASDMAGNTAFLNLSFFPRYNLKIKMNEPQSNIAIPFVLNDTYIRHVFEPINGSYNKVTSFVNGSWKTFNPDYPDKYNLDLLYVGMYMGLIVRVNSSSAKLTVSGYLPDTYSIDMRKGSNLVPYLSMHPKTVRDVLKGAPWYMIQKWDAEKGEYVNLGDYDLLLPGESYWIYLNRPCVIGFDF